MNDMVGLVFAIAHNDICPVVQAVKKRNKGMLRSLIKCYRDFCDVLDCEGKKALLREDREALEILQIMFFKIQQQINLAAVVMDIFEENDTYA